MKTKLAVAMLIAGSSLFAETHLSIGVGIGGYGYAAPPVVAYAPPSPGPGYTWVDGYWDQAGPRRFWRDGYWAPPTYRRADVSREYGAETRYEGNRDEGNHYQNSYNRDRTIGSNPFGNSYSGSNVGNRSTEFSSSANRNGRSGSFSSNPNLAISTSAGRGPNGDRSVFTTPASSGGYNPNNSGRDRNIPNGDTASTNRFNNTNGRR